MQSDAEHTFGSQQKQAGEKAETICNLSLYLE